MRELVSCEHDLQIRPPDCQASLDQHKHRCPASACVQLSELAPSAHTHTHRLTQTLKLQSRGRIVHNIPRDISISTHGSWNIRQCDSIKWYISRKPLFGLQRVLSCVPGAKTKKTKSAWFRHPMSPFQGAPLWWTSITGGSLLYKIIGMPLLSFKSRFWL